MDERVSHRRTVLGVLWDAQTSAFSAAHKRADPRMRVCSDRAHQTAQGGAWSIGYSVTVSAECHALEVYWR